VTCADTSTGKEEIMPRNTLLVVSVLNDEDEPDEDVRDRVARILGTDCAVFLGTEGEAA
jgi:hypothetical protein